MIKNKSFKLSLLTLVSLSLVACNQHDSSEIEEKEKNNLVILFTNDVHSGIEDGITIAGLSKYRNNLIDDGNDVLLVDCGDQVQGAPISTLSKGEYIIDVMNAAKYDIAIPGNHEFDYGANYFVDVLAKKANFPYISSTFYKTIDNSLVFNPYSIVEKAGYKIGFVGISTPTTISDGTPKLFKDENGNFEYTFMESAPLTEYYNAVQSSIDEVRSLGVDYVIALAHLGINGLYSSKNLVQNVSGLDALLDGHSHSVVNQDRIKDRDGNYVLVSQTGTKLEHAGELIISKRGNLSINLIDKDDVDEQDPVVINKINEINEKINKTTNQVIGHSNFDLTINEPGTTNRLIRKTCTNMGEFSSDAFLDYGKTDIALVNAGGIRASVDAGDITIGDLMEVHPFGNTFMSIKATGQMIMNLLESGAMNYPAENGSLTIPSGLTYTIDATMESNVVVENTVFKCVDGDYRVKNVLINGEPLDLDKQYTISGTSYYLNECADASVIFKDAEIIASESTTDYEVLINYLTNTLNGVVTEKYSNPLGEGRISYINL